jgi:hypothetical protein
MTPSCRKEPQRTNNKGNRNKKHTKDKQERKLNLLYCNINGIRGKMKSLKEVTDAEETDIVLMTETKSKPPILEGYTWYDLQRGQGKGGGVAIAVKDDINKYTTEVQVKEDQEQEIIWISIDFPKCKKIAVGCYYGPQENTNREAIAHQYSQLKGQIMTLKKQGGVVLTGDFNAKLGFKRRNGQQQQSRNGMLLEDIMKECNMKAISLDSETGLWTRVNRHNQSERSVIDYIMTCNEISEKTENIEIDEKGTRRLRSKTTETDHNTITASIRVPFGNPRKKIRRWKLSNDEGWRKFNKAMEERIERMEADTYEDTEEMIRGVLRKTVGTVTISTSNKKKKENQEVKERRKEKNKARSEFKKAKGDEKKERLEEYYVSQRNLRQAVLKQEKERITNLIQDIVKSRDPNTIWKMRRRIMGKKREEYDLVTEEGEVIQEQNAAKDYIAKYFETLYQAREEEENNKEWTKIINNKVEEIEREANQQPNLPDINRNEMLEATKKLKGKKSCGPDEIPNEVIINASYQVQDFLRRTLNKVMEKEKIPEAWKKGHIVTLYKGKGQRGKCSNERGITLSSNVGKFFERIINERARAAVKISDMQGGGKRGANTIDHIITLQELIRKGKQVYVAFLDVTKAYDKAWAQGILFALERQGLQDRLWLMFKKMNEDLTAKVNTKYGMTREIKMKDNIKQGGVLSVLMYATLMDEIAKEITERKLGIEISEGKKVGCLLWMDDVALISKSSEEMQTMLNVVDSIAKKYRIKFGREKSKMMKIGKKLSERKFTLGEMEMEYCQKYKYLGMVINEDNRMMEHIKETKRRAEAAYNTITAIAGNVDFKHMEMSAMWKFTETCIVPIITYGGEGKKPNKKENKERQKILDGIIKRILMTPTSTPREPLYYESGMMDIDHTIIKNRLNYWEKAKKSNNNILNTITRDKDPKSWNGETEALATEVQECQQDRQKQGKTRERHTRLRILNRMMKTMEKEGENKSKVKFYMDNKRNIQVGKRAKYLDVLTRSETGTIFKARTRMLKIKANFRNMHKDMTCRLCRKEDTEETQDHILEECEGINREDIGRITKQDIFGEDTDKLRITARKITKIMKELNCAAH